MKKFTPKIIISLVFITMLSMTGVYAQNIGINTDGTAPDNSAMLDIKSSNSGLLIPRVTLSSLTDATTITSPTHSLLVYNNSSAKGLDKGYYYNEGSPASPNWVPFLTKGNAWEITGNAGTTAGTHFLGTTDVQDLIIKTNGTERLKFDKNGGTTNPTLNVTSLADTSSGMKITVNSLTKGCALKLSSNSTAGLTGMSGYTRMIYIKQSGANSVANHSSVGIWSEISNSGTTSKNIGGEFMVSGAYTNEGVHAEVTGVADAIQQLMYGGYFSLNANSNSNALSSQYGNYIRSRGTCGTNYGQYISVESGSSSSYGIFAQNSATGSQPGYGIKAAITNTLASGTTDQNYAGYFYNLSASTISSWAYGIRAESNGVSATGVNCAAFFSATKGATGKNYAIIVPHSSEPDNYGGWVGFGCLYPKRLLQVDGIARFGGDHSLGRIEIQGALAKQTTIQAGYATTDLKFVLPGTIGNVNDVLLVSSIAGDSTTLAWGPSPTLNYWGLTGNSGTTPGTNYIGTNDFTDFVVKTNSLERLRIAGNGGVVTTSSGLVVGTNLAVGCASAAGALEVQGGNIVLNTTTNLPTFINSGTSTGAVSIGNGAAGIITVASGFGVNISTGSGFNATTTLGTSGAQVFASSTANSDKIYIVPQSVTTTASFNGVLTSNDLTAARQWNLPDASGTIALSTGAGFWNVGGNAPAASSILGTTDNSALTIQSGTGALNVGTDAAAKTITIGNTTGTSSVNINTGTNGFALSTGTGAINIGTDATAKNLTIGNTTGATSVNINTGSNGFTLQSGSGNINIGTDAVAKTLTIGTSNTTTAVDINTGTGGFDVTTGSATNASFTLGSTGNLVVASNTSGADKIAIKPQSATTTNQYTGTITSSDLTAARTWTIPDITGMVDVCSLTTLTANSNNTFTPATVNSVTTNAAITLTLQNGSAGQRATVIIISSGATTRNVTFAGNVKVNGVIATGATAGKYFSVSFIHDGTNWVETGRVATAM